MENLPQDVHLFLFEFERGEIRVEAQLFNLSTSGLRERAVDERALAALDVRRAPIDFEPQTARPKRHAPVEESLTAERMIFALIGNAEVLRDSQLTVARKTKANLVFQALLDS